MHLRKAVIFLLLFGTALVRLRAQEGTGEVFGTVRDASESVLEGVVVTASSTEPARAMTTNTGPDGSYRLQSIAPGHYQLIFSMHGFSAVEFQDVFIAPG